MERSPLVSPPGFPGRAVLGFVACGALVRRSAYWPWVGFHPRLGIGSEEALLALDRAAAGWELQYIEEIVAHYHRADTDGPRSHAPQRDPQRDLGGVACGGRSRRAALERTPALPADAVRAQRPGSSARRAWWTAAVES